MPAKETKKTAETKAPEKATSKPVKAENQTPASKAAGNENPMIKKIKIMASYDWTMRQAMVEFVKFYDPVITYKKKKHKLELGRIVANPIICGQDLSKEVDFLVDRTTHWNAFYKMWAQQALNSGVQSANHPNTFENHDKHHTYDLMARAIHPADVFPKTVLLPQFAPYTPDQEQQDMWEYYQSLIIHNTKFGWDPHRRTTNWEKINESYDKALKFKEKNRLMRDQFYPKDNYLKDVIDNIFEGKFPLWLKKAFGGGGSDVFKISNIDELYQKYDETGGRVFHLQESVEEYDIFIRCMAIGPQVLPMKYQPDAPLHQHYSPDKIKVKRSMFRRLEAYVMLINAYHRWTYNSFECILKDGKIHPIDFANACPDSNFTSLHAHFPWLICALTRWFSFCAVAGKDMRCDMEQMKYLSVLNDPKISQEEKFEHHRKLSRDYFELERFEEFCEENFKDMTDAMIAFYDKAEASILETAIKFSDFPEYEHEKFYYYYKDLIDNTFRKAPKDYLTTVIFED